MSDQPGSSLTNLSLSVDDPQLQSIADEQFLMAQFKQPHDIDFIEMPQSSEGEEALPQSSGGGEALPHSSGGGEALPHSSGGGKAEAPSRVKAKKDIEVFSAKEYVKRRNRNNIAVKKSRERSKQKGEMTLENIGRLKEENVKLEEKVEVLSKELSVLKKVFMDHARGFSGAGDNTDLPDLKLLEKLLGHKLTDKSSDGGDDQPSTSYTS